jgi:hypothetical protein
MSKYTKCFGAGVRLVNLGSFTFLSALACRGWKNVKVPKFAVGCVGFFGRRWLLSVMLAILVAFNVMRLCEYWANVMFFFSRILIAQFSS